MRVHGSNMKNILLQYLADYEANMLFYNKHSIPICTKSMYNINYKEYNLYKMKYLQRPSYSGAKHKISKNQTERAYIGVNEAI